MTEIKNKTKSILDGLVRETTKPVILAYFEFQNTVLSNKGQLKTMDIDWFMNGYPCSMTTVIEVKELIAQLNK